MKTEVTNTQPPASVSSPIYCVTLTRCFRPQNAAEQTGPVRRDATPAESAPTRTPTRTAGRPPRFRLSPAGSPPAPRRPGRPRRRPGAVGDPVSGWALAPQPASGGRGGRAHAGEGRGGLGARRPLPGPQAALGSEPAKKKRPRWEDSLSAVTRPRGFGKGPRVSQRSLQPSLRCAA